MEKGGPSSPVPSNTLTQIDDSLHSGFQRLLQHNAAASISYSPPEHQSAEIGSHIGSNPHSRYSSPGPQANMATGYDHHTPTNHASPFAAPTYAGGYQAAYQVDPSPYPQLLDMASSTNSHNAYSTPATSPPTPVQVEGMTTRSGRAIMRPSVVASLARPPRVEKPPPRSRGKKRKRVIGDAYSEDRSMMLSGPLSQLVKDITNIIDTDIQAYVNRSPEERQQEVAQSKTGKVKRPMNAFMLYRKAYQNRTKEWKRLEDIRRREENAGDGRPEKGHDNHQVISQVCGSSWNIEPQELRDQYDEWAKIERNNHKLAFPDYKFAPAKSKVKKTAAGESGGGSRHGDRGDSDDDNASNLDAYDFNEWAPTGSGPPSRNTTRSAHYMDPDADYVLPPGYSHSVYTSPSPGIQHARLPPGYMPQQRVLPPHPSSFHYSNPGKPRPADYGSALGQGQYYQQSSEFAHQAYPQRYAGAAYGVHHPQGVPAFVENVFMNKTNSPSSYHNNSPVLDHRTYSELMASSGGYGPPVVHPHTAIPHPQATQYLRHAGDHPIDPSLMAAHQAASGAGGSHVTHHEAAYDTLGLLGLGQGSDFASDGLSGYHLDQAVADGLGRNHIGSPRPQQFEQTYQPSANESTTTNTTTTAAGGTERGGGDGDAVSHAAESSWQDVGPSPTSKIGSADWETTLSGAAEFQLDDIDQILGTTADSPGG